MRCVGVTVVSIRNAIVWQECVSALKKNVIPARRALFYTEALPPVIVIPSMISTFRGSNQLVYAAHNLASAVIVRM